MQQHNWNTTVIYKLRSATGLTQAEFCEKYHISIYALQSWEQGLRKPSETVIYMLKRLIMIDFGKTIN